MSNNPYQTITAKNAPAFSTTMTDDAQITFGAPVGPGELSFTDTGLMPINTLTIGGTTQQLDGRFDGLYLQYTGTGVQHFSATGQPTTADYTSLHYELVGYKGDATFGHASTGAATVSGADHMTVLAQGDLINGALGFNPNGSISGAVAATFVVKGQTTGTLALSVQHAAQDITPNAAGFTLDGGSITAAFIPAPGKH